jgi:hypothetical protein
MKRALWIALAALLVILVYPSTHPLAKSPRAGVPDGPEIAVPLSLENPSISLVGENDGDGDDGDADDLSGYKSGKTNPTGSSGNRVGQGRFVLMLKMWWNYVIRIR